MSKCSEAYEMWLHGLRNDADIWESWQAAWNARGKVDAEIARTQADPWAAIGYEQCAKDCAEAIEQEDEK